MNFIATIHGIYDNTKSQFAVSTATHPPGQLDLGRSTLYRELQYLKAPD